MKSYFFAVLVLYFNIAVSADDGYDEFGKSFLCSGSPQEYSRTLPPEYSWGKEPEHGEKMGIRNEYCRSQTSNKSSDGQQSPKKKSSMVLRVERCKSLVVNIKTLVLNYLANPINTGSTYATYAKSSIRYSNYFFDPSASDILIRCPNWESLTDEQKQNLIPNILGAVAYGENSCMDCENYASDIDECPTADAPNEDARGAWQAPESEYNAYYEKYGGENGVLQSSALWAAEEPKRSKCLSGCLKD
jgi:hypothetical protein